MEITDVFDFLTVFLTRRLLEKLRVFEIRSTRGMLAPTIGRIRRLKRLFKEKLTISVDRITRNFRFLRKLSKGKRKRQFLSLLSKRPTKSSKGLKKKNRIKKKKEVQTPKDYLHLL